MVLIFFPRINKKFVSFLKVRKIVIGNLPFLLSDTVGFIRKLPHQLVESFKSTLDEVREADILLHVRVMKFTQIQVQLLDQLVSFLHHLALKT